MAASVQRWRLALFCLCAGTLLLAALGFSSGGPGSNPTPPIAPVAPASMPAQGPGASGLRTAARRFLAAFLRYEAGEGNRPAVRRALRATATPAFAAELLGAPPRLPHRPPPPARIERLVIAAIPIAPPRALVSGVARRGRRREQFSFLFDLRRERWLARGLGE